MCKFAMWWVQLLYKSQPKANLAQWAETGETIPKEPDSTIAMACSEPTVAQPQDDPVGAARRLLNGECDFCDLSTGPLVVPEASCIIAHDGKEPRVMHVADEKVSGISLSGTTTENWITAQEQDLAISFLLRYLSPEDVCGENELALMSPEGKCYYKERIIKRDFY